MLCYRNIAGGNYIYAEYLAYESRDSSWRYHSGNLFEEGKKVTAWQPGPGNLING